MGINVFLNLDTGIYSLDPAEIDGFSIFPTPWLINLQTLLTQPLKTCFSSFNNI